MLNRKEINKIFFWNYCSNFVKKVIFILLGLNWVLYVLILDILIMWLFGDIVLILMFFLSKMFFVYNKVID